MSTAVSIAALAAILVWLWAAWQAQALPGLEMVGAALRQWQESHTMEEGAS